MEKKYQDYFDFIESMLNDKSKLPTDIKMKMIRQQTKSLITQEFNNYANDVTKHYNEYIKRINDRLS